MSTRDYVIRKAFIHQLHIQIDNVKKESIKNGVRRFVSSQYATEKQCKGNAPLLFLSQEAFETFVSPVPQNKDEAEKLIVSQRTFDKIECVTVETQIEEFRYSDQTKEAFFFKREPKNLFSLQAYLFVGVWEVRGFTLMPMVGEGWKLALSDLKEEFYYDMLNQTYDSHVNMKYSLLIE